MTRANTRTDVDTECNQIVAWYTLLASGTGAVPIPIMSTAIVAENSAMVVHISARYGVDVDLGAITSSMGAMAVLNMVGRQVFIEGARLLSWGTGNVWAAVALSGLGATTAGVQTYVIGQIAMAIAHNGGKPLSGDVATKIVENARNSYADFIAYWKDHRSELRQPAR